MDGGYGLYRIYWCRVNRNWSDRLYRVYRLYWFSRGRFYGHRANGLYGIHGGYGCGL